ncbi:MAG: hypothetical protein PHO80_04390 [Candidatus Gracilibacteria bacterium]|nr:hypothetical protein [Candidatus Gracilibacteria bacterium]
MFFGFNQKNLKRAVRGALLHDFYLYDWRNYEKANIKYLRKSHAIVHPKIAADNANEIFGVDKIERDIIAKHMWPIVFGLPKYRISWIVTIADKIETTYEYFYYFKNKKLINPNNYEYGDI